jgi:beta-glucosidase
MKKILTLTLALCACVQITEAKPNRSTLPQIEKQITGLITTMTLEEKLDMLSGMGFNSKPIKRLGIPDLRMTDGPVGVRWSASTAFPVSIMLAATWDTSLAYRYGWALAREAKAKERNVILGPCININRVPQGGRNFESYGEDPFLTSRIAVSYVQGVQSQNVIATVKHFATNNQEWQRESINNKVGLRALYEIYLPAFKAAVQEGKAMAIMSAYNKLNGSYCSENSFLLQDILKTEWKFDGIVMSDWGAVHSTLETANNGLDLEMPDGRYLNRTILLPLVKEGKIKESIVDDKIRRMLRVMFRAGLFDTVRVEKPKTNDPAHRKVALDVARSGIILLKNDNAVLPLNTSALKSVAVIGPNAAVARTGGGGSSMVEPVSAESPLDAIKKALGSRVTINYAVGSRMAGDVAVIDPSVIYLPHDTTGKHGLLGEYFTNAELSGEPALRRIDSTIDFRWGSGSPAAGIGVDFFSVRWTGKIRPAESGLYELTAATDDGVRLYINDKLVIDNWTNHGVESKSVRYEMAAGASYDIRMEYYEYAGDAVALLGWTKPGQNELTEAVAAAQKSDVALLFVGNSFHQESEGFDRPSIELDPEQVALINAVAKANQNTVVVLQAGAQVTMENWIDNVRGVVYVWFPGQEGAQAIAEMLTGAINPSGKLPVTIPKRWEDCSAFNSYPGKNGETEYSDGIFVGYRHFDEKNIDVRYPFGYGMSYTTFALSNLKVAPVAKGKAKGYTVKVTVENTGGMAGEEVVQVYIHDVKAKILRPAKELKAFTKLLLQPKEKRMVVLQLNKDSFSYYDDTKRAWAATKGEYEVLVGTSSRNLTLKQSITVR